MNKFTVKDVDELINSIAKKYKLDDPKDVKDIIGVTDRTLRRWKAKCEVEPDNQSTITYLPLVCLISINKGEFVLQHEIQHNLKKQIPENYIFSAQDYVCPPFEFLKTLVGKKNLLGWTLKELAERLKCSHVQLGADIKKEKISYLTYNTILMFCGFTPDEVFKLKNVEPPLLVITQDGKEYEFKNNGKSVTVYFGCAQQHEVIDNVSLVISKYNSVVVSACAKFGHVNYHLDEKNLTELSTFLKMEIEIIEH